MKGSAAGRLLKTMGPLFALILLISSFSYAMFEGGFLSWFLFGALTPFVLYSTLLIFYPVSRIHVERKFEKSEYGAGDFVQIRYRIRFPWRFPLLYMAFWEEDAEKVEIRTEKSLKFLIHPLFRREMEVEVPLGKVPRGQYDFKKIQILIGDLPGFIEKQSATGQADHFIVIPSVEEVYSALMEYHFEQSSATARHPAQKEAQIPVSVREYHPGDRFSWIHWKTTAKKNELMTKEFEHGRTNDVLLVIDGAPVPEFEVLISFAASIARHFVKNGGNVGLYAAGNLSGMIPVRGGKEHLHSLFLELAKVEADPGRMLHHIIESERETFYRHRSIVFLTARPNRKMVEAIGSLPVKNRQFSLFVVNRKFPPAEDLAVMDEAGQRGISTRLFLENQYSGGFWETGWK
jgi:Protein of unknown function DUF58.